MGSRDTFQSVLKSWGDGTASIQTERANRPNQNLASTSVEDYEPTPEFLADCDEFAAARMNIVEFTVRALDRAASVRRSGAVPITPQGRPNRVRLDRETTQHDREFRILRIPAMADS